MTTFLTLRNNANGFKGSRFSTYENINVEDAEESSESPKQNYYKLSTLITENHPSINMLPTSFLS
jgi:hypothetical protein